MQKIETMGPDIETLGVETLGSDMMGFGISTDDANAIGKKLANQSVGWGAISARDLAAALKVYDPTTRQQIIAAYQIAGGSLSLLNDAQERIKYEENPPSGGWLTSRNVTYWSIISTISGAVSAYHGYKRNNSVGWGIGWFILGSIFPVLTPVIAFAQGYAKPRVK
jgi:hypothetical protein